MSTSVTVTKNLSTQETTVQVIASDCPVDSMLADLKRVFPDLAIGSANAAETPMDGAHTASSGGEVIPPVEKKITRKKKSEPETIEGEAKQIDLEEKIAETAVEIPNIDEVRNMLKTVGATDGLGHDKVFEVLGKYNAKNASGIPEDKRQAVIDDCKALLDGAGK